ncbi:hypothetical protein BXZ70DRAFT_906818 [Cristinia sonorae]|uniref:Uncharacterized protein n=1 Tax=Cristinia sonorae TaxID=1940300 RepID=A0A8K0UPL3_9AGAR|nr:hypothetical protein BXZ70DRAFT_906818 [Cristinia sonorae]
MSSKLKILTLSATVSQSMNSTLQTVGGNTYFQSHSQTVHYILSTWTLWWIPYTFFALALAQQRSAGQKVVINIPRFPHETELATERSRAGRSRSLVDLFRRRICLVLTLTASTEKMITGNPDDVQTLSTHDQILH